MSTENLTSSLSAIDISLVFILGVFAIFGFLSGFTKRVLSIFAWIISFLGSLYLFPFVRSLLSKHFDMSVTIKIVIFCGCFVFLLFISQWFSGRISKIILASPLKMLDRLLGLLFGILIGTFILSGITLIARQFIPVNATPSYFSESRALRFTNLGANLIQAWLPSDVDSHIKTPYQPINTPAELDAAKHILGTLKPTPKVKSYAEEQRQKLNKLFDEIDAAPEEKKHA